MSKRQKLFLVHLRPKQGQTEVSEFIRLNGYVKSMGVYTRKTEDNLILLETANPLIFMSVQDDANGDIVPMIILDNYKPTTGGDYEKGFKPLGFVANNETFKVTVKTERASTGVTGQDIEVFAYFFIGEEPIKRPVQTAPPTTQAPIKNAMPARPLR